MKQQLFKIAENRPLAPKVFCMRLLGDTAPIAAPGQFVNLKIKGFYLRRPISISNWDDRSLTVIYKTVGAGTEKLSHALPGESLDVLFALGNGFNPAPAGERPVLVGGGVGAPPLFGLCRALLRQGAAPQVVLGFNTASEVFLEKEFLALGVPVTVTTADGSYGQKGFVTAALQNLSYTYLYACGPLPMLKAVSEQASTPGQLNFEARMGCGFGACRGCTVQTKNGPKRICLEGPVLTKEEVLW